MMIMRHMIQETITYTCHSCGSINIIKNGTNKCGNQQYHCKDCRVYRVLKPTVQAQVEQKEQVDDVLELDEVWSFVGQRAEKRWLWTAMCRRTRQIVAFVIGDHSEATCRRLWQAIPKAYRRCRSYSDFWKAYAAVFPAQSHESVGKESGQTAHMERWYNTLRQRLGRYTRKTLSFSKKDANHSLVTRWFITEHNMQMLELSLT